MSPARPPADPNMLDVSPARVRTSATEVADLAAVAATCRSTLATAMAGHPMAWQQAGRPGFATFVDILHGQSERIRTDLTVIAEQLQEAATAYEDDDRAAEQQLTVHPGPTLRPGGTSG